MRPACRSCSRASWRRVRPSTGQLLGQGLRCWGRPAPPSRKRLWRWAKLVLNWGPGWQRQGGTPSPNELFVAVPAMPSPTLARSPGPNARRRRWPTSTNSTLRAAGALGSAALGWITGDVTRARSSGASSASLALEPVAHEQPRSARSACPGPSSPPGPSHSMAQTGAQLPRASGSDCPPTTPGAVGWPGRA